MMSANNYSFVNYLWDNAVAAKLDPVAKLIYRSNLLGSDQRITNTGGGNTSAKLTETDPLTGQPVTVLWVKGSGGDLRTAKKENFSSLYQDKLMALQDTYAKVEPRGVKTPVEDAMVEMYLHTTFNLNPRPPSIDTPLHSFIPARHVDHTHPNAVIAIAASKNSAELTKKIYGDEVIWTAWQRPGFDLGLQLQEVCRQNPQAKGIIMGQHGLINWAETDEECYDLSLMLIEKAARYLAENDKGTKSFGGAKYQSLPETERRDTLAQLLPWLRGKVSQQRRFIGTWQDDEATLTFVNSHAAERLAELGTSCPDHFLRTKIKPLYVDWNPQSEKIDSLKKKLEKGIESYRKDYLKYYEKCKKPNSPAVRDSNPTVVLVPGVGMIAWGKDKSESRVTAEFYGCAIQVMRGAEAVDTYIALPQQEAFDIEYWLLEEAKLKRMPAEKELARQIIGVFGAGSGIGREVALRLVKEGAHVVGLDLNQAGVDATTKEITDKYGLGIGVAGSGVSNCGPAVAVSADVTKRESIRAALKQAVLAYGGLDSIAVTAGIFVPPDTAGNIADDKWALTFAINVTGGYLVADEAKTLWNEQGLRGSLVLTTSANAVVAKKGSVAYDTSKAAANHLVRELAVELSPLIRVNGVAPATVIQGSAMFPRERVIASLAKYKIPYKDDEPSEALTTKLAQFYAERTLTKSPITPADQAEAIFLLLTNRLSKTTGQVITVDGGLHEAFLR
jgi:rhamnulose-1-phosphate aldolase/alcohol dehydrogenase